LSQPSVPDLVECLHNRGVQLWHNRGGLFAGPLSELTADERRHLQHHKPEVIAYLKRHPLNPRWPQDLIAPRPVRFGSYAGPLMRKPWDYELAVVLPHLGTLDLLRASVACWRHQTVSPYLVVIDTGTQPMDAADLEELRSYDLEIHFINSHGWRHSSSPVAAALDLAFAVCQQRYALLTHVDVFPKAYTLIEDLLPRCSASCPVVGYQMSFRFGSEEWKKITSHTLTLVDLAAMRRVRVTWNLLAVLEADNEVEDRYFGWPDTETQFGRSLSAEGIVPEFLGPESNAHVYETEHIVHWRSLPSVRHYLPEEAEVRYPGLIPWLAETAALGRAAPLPKIQSVAGDAAGDAAESQPRAQSPSEEC